MELKRPRMIVSPLMSEVILRIIIWASFIFMELLSPFVRIIQPEDMYLYKYPHTGYQYVQASMLWFVAIVIPITVLSLDYLFMRNRDSYKQGMLSLTLLLGLNGLLTVFLKITVGRPRPDFYYRCWPNGTDNLKMECSGERKSIVEGRKSFPSGHASFSFASMMFVSLFLAQRLKTFDKNRGEAWRLVACLLPLLLATTISISRTCDYHHHWQDVTIGGLIGAVLAYICYYQYYPLPTTRSNTLHTASVAD